MEPVNDERRVDLSEEDPLLPESTVDDTDAGWGERKRPDDDWWQAERPPHWD